MATREKMQFDDRTFYVETFEEGGQWKGRFVIYGCAECAQQERKFEVEGIFPTSTEARDAARRAAIQFAT